MLDTIVGYLFALQIISTPVLLILTVRYLLALGRRGQ